MLPGIQALVQVMRSEVSEYFESDMLATSGVRFENDFAGAGSISKAVIPSSNRVQHARNSLVGESYGTDANLPVQNTTIQQAKPVYTVLTSKNKFHPTVSDARSSGRSELSNASPSLRLNGMIPGLTPDLTPPNKLSSPINSTCPSAFHKTLPTSINAGPTSNVMCSSARSNPGSNKPSPINQPACYLTTWKFQKILPKIPNASSSPANSMLYQLLKRNTTLTSQNQNPQRISIVSKFPSTGLPPNVSSTKRKNGCTKSGVKARCPVLPQSSSRDECLRDVKVQLAKEDLWKLFYEQGNEMIVSKPGRPIFPRLDLCVSGLDPEEMYSIAVRLVCVDKYRYHYKTSLDSWEQTYEDTHQPGHPRCFEHPQSPANGQTLNAKLLSFAELRLTNRATRAENMAHAPTMRKHRFQLVVTLLRCSSCNVKHTRHIDLPLTEFIAVSSYYSLAITQLKITHNPLAKTKGLNAQPKRKSRDNKSSEDVPTLETKKQKTECLPNVLQSSLSSLPSTPSSQLPPTSSQVTSGIKPAKHCLSSSTATYPQPSVINTTENPKSPMERCNTVFTCQTTKPTAHVQTDEDILEFIKIYLSPFLTTEKNEDLDSSVFDELYKINSISEKMDNFDNCNAIQRLPLC